jgi:N-formylmaleamate deformylase
MTRAAWIALACAAACGHAPPPVGEPAGEPRRDRLFADRELAPRSFAVEVSGHGRPVIFVPGLGCPGAMWRDTIARLPNIEAHVLTLAGFAGEKPIKPPLAATVRKELVRYIRAHHLVRPIVVGHSLGGFVAYWLAATAPDMLGGVIVVDAGPAIPDNDPETAHALRNMWAQAGDDELAGQVATAYGGLVADPKHIAPFLDAIARSDRQTIGDAIYELVTTDISGELAHIRAPLLLVLADGGLQQRYRAQAEPVADHEVVVIAKAKHFVMLDEPDAFASAVANFLATHANDTQR